MIAAILRAQWLSMRPSLGFGTLAAVIWYGFWLVAAAVAGFFASHTPVETLRYAFPVGLMAVCIYWQAMPIISASMGSSLDLRKLLAYPTPHDQLFFIELLLRAVSGIEMQMILVGGAIGLMLNRAAGGLVAVASLAIAIPLFAMFNLLLSSGTRSVLERLLSRRKVRELVGLLVAIAWLVPRFLFMTGKRPTWLHAAGAAMGAFGWPWSAASHAALPMGASAGYTALSWLSLGVWVGLAGVFGRSQFERSLRFDALAAQATPMAPVSARVQGLSERFYRVPGLIWNDPLAAIVEKELRTLMRAPRFRMVFVMGFAFGLMFWLPMVLGRNGHRSGFLTSNFLVIVCIYAMTLVGQVTFWNCFGIDRSAATFYFAAPQPISRTLLGKNIACLFFVYLEAVVLMLLTQLFRVNYTIGQAIETFVVIGVCAAYLMGLGNISSVKYPRALNAERATQSSGGKPAQALVMLFYPVVLLPVILAYVARFAFESQAAFTLVLSFAAALAAVFYWLAMDSAVKTASQNRQSILQELSRGDGPVAS